MEAMFYSFQSDRTKDNKVLIFLTPLIFCNTTRPKCKLFSKQKNEEIVMDKIVRYKESSIRKKEIGHSKSIDCGYDLLQSGFNGFAIPGRFGLAIEKKSVSGRVLVG